MANIRTVIAPVARSRASRTRLKDSERSLKIVSANLRHARMMYASYRSEHLRCMKNDHAAAIRIGNMTSLDWFLQMENQERDEVSRLESEVNHLEQEIVWLRRELGVEGGR